MPEEEHPQAVRDEERSLQGTCMECRYLRFHDINCSILKKRSEETDNDD